jgi:hypothetical protein
VCQLIETQIQAKKDAIRALKETVERTESKLKDGFQALAGAMGGGTGEEVWEEDLGSKTTGITLGSLVDSEIAGLL